MLRTPRPCLAWLLLALVLRTPPLGAQEALRTAPNLPLDVTQIDLDLEVDLEAQRISGTASLTLSARRDVQLMSFDAANLSVESVRWSQGDVIRAVDFSSSDQHLTVHLPLARGEGGTLVVRYAAEQPRAGLFFYKPTADAPEVPYQVWSQGESEGNRWWFPCVDHPAERAATSLTAHVAKGLTVISNGELLGTEEGETHDTWRFRQTREHPAYLVSLVVGTFDVERDTWRGKPLGYFVPPGRKQDIPRSFSETKGMLDFFSELTGEEYPWPKYDQTVVEQFSWGGMENTGATTLNERTLHDERAHLDFSSEPLVAHELAHQWFGDLITCRDWAHVWLNESFATYLQALWVEHRQGPDDFAREMLGKMDGGLGAGASRPILDRRYASPDTMFDGRAYPKGACVLHMLRARLGEETWLRGLRRYVRDAKDQSVETWQLRRAMEAESGLSLERYFHDWLEQPGHPELEVRLSHDADTQLATVVVEQTQKERIYELPLTVVLGWGPPEQRTTAEQRQVTAERTVRFTFPSPTPPTWFRFDPREEVLLKQAKVQKPRALWIAQLQSDTTWGRLRAARQLEEDRHAESTEALTAALAGDPYWGVREACAAALGSRPQGRAPLRAALAGQEHPTVRRACVQALQQLGRDGDTARQLALLLEAGDPSYAVEEAALRALVKVADAPEGHLRAYLDKPSHNERLRIAALDGLADLDEAEQRIPTFVAFTARGYAPRVRQVAARALRVAGQVGTPPELKAKALEALTGLLREGGMRIRQAALDALNALGGEARPALAAVEAVVESDPEPFLRQKAEGVRDRIRSGAKPEQELRRLREEVERLEAQEGELRKRLEKLEAKQGAK
ncbi:MAG: HEAT repeat domain-containing protein [Planctomycetes bacterium]|nr:HEAT repeat domain-containing protein [Planctomycetota bacterium]